MEIKMLNKRFEYNVKYANETYLLQENVDMVLNKINVKLFDNSNKDITDTKIGIKIISQFFKEQ